MADDVDEANDNVIMGVEIARKAAAALKRIRTQGNLGQTKIMRLWRLNEILRE